ncbi:hypothetical protein FKW77_008063 [Venturia effusa]|uniref:L-lactate dehydrogenase n=1 Tax=Venturia effusa TaxID=50376 RepID=A0A517KZT9_9PEZI|nr:hypothetical protein FKW77_008063 [Venturia effusa]
MNGPKLTSHIAILGAGSVGSAIAYALILNPIAGDILLVDPQEEMRDAQVKDLSDATFHGSTECRIRAGTHKEAGQCDIVVITAGAKQKKGESRTDLIGRNQKILKSAINDMKPFKEDAVLLLVANPVDILTFFAQKYSGLPRTQVLGTGTFLDSSRLRGFLAKEADVSASSIDAFVLGEHGESQFVAWSIATIAGVPISTALPDNKLNRQAIADATRDKAASIIDTKGATNYGIGAVTSSICKSILHDHRNIRPVSHFVESLNVCISVLTVLGRKGIVRNLPVHLSEEEQEKLQKSAKSLRNIIDDAEKHEDDNA